MALAGNDDTTTEDPATTLLRLSGGVWLGQAIAAAAELKIADCLVDGPKDVEALAGETGAHAPSLRRLLRALAGSGIFAEDEQGRYGLTPLAAPLRTDVPGSVAGVCRFRGSPWFLAAWGEVAHSVRTGESAFRHVHGTDLFTYLARNPAAAATFNQAMSDLSGGTARAVMGAFDFARFGTVVDVGGGQGALLTAILRANPGTRGVLFDLPPVADRARAHLSAAGLGERATAVGGSFFEAVPAGGDLYVLRLVIHDWDDEQAVAILRSCRRAMGAAGRLLLVEAVIPPGNIPSAGKLMDLTMLVVAGGKERTEAEFRSLYARAGFALTAIVPTASEQSLIEGTPLQAGEAGRPE